MQQASSQFLGRNAGRIFRNAGVQNLPNRDHTLELVAVGDGEVTIDGLYVFQPPEKD